MKEEQKIEETLAGCYRHAPLITDDFQRHGIENFIAGLEYCLEHNEIITVQVDARKKELAYKEVTNDKILEEALKLHLNIVDLDGRSIVLKER